MKELPNALGPYVEARVGFEPATLRTEGNDRTIRVIIGIIRNIIIKV